MLWQKISTSLTQTIEIYFLLCFLSRSYSLTLIILYIRKLTLTNKFVHGQNIFNSRTRVPFILRLLILLKLNIRNNFWIFTSKIQSWHCWCKFEIIFSDNTPYITCFILNDNNNLLLLNKRKWSRQMISPFSFIISEGLINFRKNPWKFFEKCLNFFYIYILLKHECKLRSVDVWTIDSFRISLGNQQNTVLCSAHKNN